MTPQYAKLKALLLELFQLDQPDLDFGLYRVMHAKRDEVTAFLDRELLPQVQQALAQYQSADKAALEQELAKVVAGVEAAGLNPDDSPKVKELRTRIATEAVDVRALEREVYDHLYSFFRRYYSEGDFLAKRVYKPGVYAIPYEGEEVTLHWANKDQYYIKTSEYLRNYTFRLRPDDEANPMRVHFRLVDALEGEHGNVKAAEGKERRFKLAAEQPLVVENSELVVRFTYLPDANKQLDLNTEAERAILSSTESSFANWITELKAPAPTEKEPSRTVFAKHLKSYSDRNTFDYFIHKDLSGFLRRELDFYIKNEVMHLDDVESETSPRVKQYLSKIKVLRRIAGKIIEFLAQLENFQRKLWLKRKLVVEASWCVKIGIVPRIFYPEIAANDSQREEWIRQCAIDDIRGDLIGTPYTVPLTSDFLVEHPSLVLDTRHFNASFVARLVDSLGDSLAAMIDGVLIQSENFQALQLLRTPYTEKVDMVYADPPYNTSEESFLYKNLYRHSSWLSMMWERAEVAYATLAPSGVAFFAIDDAEVARLTLALEDLFGASNSVGNLVVQSNPRGRGINSFFATSHDYYVAFARDATQASIYDLPLTEDQAADYSHGDTDRPFRLLPFRRSGGLSTPEERPNSEFPLYFDHVTKQISTIESPGSIAIMPIDSSGRRRVWRWSDREKINEAGARGDFVVRENDGRHTVLLKDYFKPGRKPKTVWADSKYDASSHGTNLLQSVLGDRRLFSYPKSIFSVEDALRSGLVDDGLALDYFAGSGTTGHAVINLNREDGGRRRFVLVEMGDYFDTVLVPRLKKITYTPEWKDGKPKRFSTAEEAERAPRIVKVIRLESYEDTLNNLETRRRDDQQLLLDAPGAQGPDGLKEQYVLRYMLDVETRASQSLLNVQAFTDPTAYKLTVKRPGSDESRQVNVDLLETFNWLLGLTVRHIAAPQTFSAAFVRDGEGRLRLEGDRIKADAEGPYWFRTVTGTLPDGRAALVIWRKCTGDPERDNLVLDTWFTKQGYSSKDSEFDLIYVNGGTNLENLKTPDDRWKVRLLEEDFHRLMFEGTE
jgi:adenine-specific DNA-methyltransferase